jgi:hypothetical protein
MSHHTLLSGITQKLISLCTCFDDDGIEMMFFNSSVQGFNVNTAADATKLLHNVQPGHASSSVAQALYVTTPNIITDFLH